MQVLIDRINSECLNKASEYFVPWTISNVHTRLYCKYKKGCCLEEDFCSVCQTNTKSVGKVSVDSGMMLIMRILSDQENTISCLDTTYRQNIEKLTNRINILEEHTEKLLAIAESQRKSILFLTQGQNTLNHAMRELVMERDSHASDDD
jgi:hypothetical protein